MADGASGWTFLTNHARVLVLVASEPDLRVRDLAARIGITERAVQGIVRDLADGGYVQVTREGRRNRYAVVAGLPFRHPAEAEHQVGELLDLFRAGAASAGR